MKKEILACALAVSMAFGATGCENSIVGRALK